MRLFSSGRLTLTDCSLVEEGGTRSEKAKSAHSLRLWVLLYISCFTEYYNTRLILFRSSCIIALYYVSASQIMFMQ